MKEMLKERKEDGWESIKTLRNKNNAKNIKGNY